MRCPKELKDKVLLRMMAPGNEAVPALWREFNIKVATAWRRSAWEAGSVTPGDGRNAERWSGQAKFSVVLETSALAEAEGANTAVRGVCFRSRFVLGLLG